MTEFRHPRHNENIVFDSLVYSVTCRYFRVKVLVVVVAEVTEEGQWTYAVKRSCPYRTSPARSIRSSGAG